MLWLLALPGCCPPATFRVETAVLSDGSCQRSICQPKDSFLPSEALTEDWSKQWESVSGAPCPPAAAAPALPLDGYPYFLARGPFNSPDDIPPHYRYVNDKFPETGASEIVRTYRRTEYGFLIQHCWEERITNIVTLRRFLAARDELFDLAIPLVAEAVEKELGESYDVSGLVGYLRGDGRRWLEELALALYDAATQNLSEAEFTERLVDEAARHGLDLRDHDGALASDVQAEQRTKDFFARLIAKVVRKRDGSALTRDEIERLLEQDPSDPKFLEKRLHAVEDRLGPILVRMVGLYNPFSFLFQGPLRYQFALELPGQLVQANGSLLSANRVVWRFTSSELYPSGYAMKATSVEFDRDVQEKILGRVCIGDAEKATEFIELVGNDGPLLEAMQSIKKNGTLQALDGVRTRSMAEDRRLRKVREILLGE